MTQNQASNNPLNRIVVEGDKIDLELLADTVAPFAKIYRVGDKADIRLTDEGRELNYTKQILVYLLARKAIAYLDNPPISEEEQGLSPSELEEKTRIKGNTLRPTLRRLVDEQLLSNDKQFGGYHIPNYALKDVSKYLAE